MIMAFGENHINKNYTLSLEISNYIHLTRLKWKVNLMREEYTVKYVWRKHINDLKNVEIDKQGPNFDYGT